jgi:hypothetical protein
MDPMVTDDCLHVSTTKTFTLGYVLVYICIVFANFYPVTLSIQYAHRECVQRWCNEKGDISCEICHEVTSHLFFRSASAFCAMILVT